MVIKTHQDLPYSEPRAPIKVSPLGPVPVGWRVVRLKNITTKIGSGATPQGGSQSYLASRQRYALVRSQNVFDRSFSDNGLAFINDEQAAQLKIAEILSGDVLLNITGDGITFGRACLAPQRVLPACVNQHVSIIRPDPSVCISGYLLSYLTHPDIKGYIESFNAGGSRRAITKGHIESFEIPLPPLAEQRAIAHALDSIDEKIELNRQINKTLEAMAKAIFKSWFVGFDPVQAKVEGRSPSGISADVAKFFPCSFQPSEIGPIPHGWSVQNLPAAIEVNPSRRLQVGQTAPYLDMANMPTNSCRATEVIDRELSSGMKFMNGDTLLARITPCLENGKTAYVDFLKDGEVGWGSTEYIVLRSKPPLPLEYTYFLARSREFRDFAIVNMTGTSGRQRVPASCFDSYKMAVPSPEVAKVFGDFAKNVMRGIKQKDEESRTLVQIRDALLPKLLSGEIRLAQAEAIVGNHL